ncbi:MAG: TraR/DksA family transcriptional regulator [Lysobacterales bacterium]
MPHDPHAELIAALHRQREQISATLAQLDEASRPVQLDQSAQGRVSRIDAIGQQQMAMASRQNLGLELARIDAALLRHREHRYGDCCRCGEAIAPGRLRAAPAAALCLACAQASEA